MMINDLFKSFKENADEQQAAKMKAYMKNLFPFLGIPSPKRKELSKEFLTSSKKANQVEWNFVNECWEMPEREFQYLAINYLEVVSKLLTTLDVHLIREIAIKKSWWDTIDGLDKVVGSIALKHPEVNSILLEWSTDENMWLRRIAIDHQLSRKEKTDAELLEQIIINNLGQSEFFINKAIGWSLREYSKTNPNWVKSFLNKYKDKLNTLSFKEASKYI